MVGAKKSAFDGLGGACPPILDLDVFVQCGGCLGRCVAPRDTRDFLSHRAYSGSPLVPDGDTARHSCLCAQTGCISPREKTAPVESLYVQPVERRMLGTATRPIYCVSCLLFFFPSAGDTREAPVGLQVDRSVGAGRQRDTKTCTCVLCTFFFFECPLLFLTVCQTTPVSRGARLDFTRDRSAHESVGRGGRVEISCCRVTRSVLSSRTLLLFFLSICCPLQAGQNRQSRLTRPATHRCWDSACPHRSFFFLARFLSRRTSSPFPSFLPSSLQFSLPSFLGL